ncbi:MAG: hypothetical protein GY847_34035 [Proteobacteria bacterium]|nr:hypothetical protein [Pseudomonadota bacterium]
MLQTSIAANDSDTMAYGWSEIDSVWDGDSVPDEQKILDTALDLIERGSAVEADELLTAVLVKKPRNGRLWLAAGISRLDRGALRSAACAFEMSAWLSDDPEARELLALCEKLVSAPAMD